MRNQIAKLTIAMSIIAAGLLPATPSLASTELTNQSAPIQVSPVALVKQPKAIPLESFWDRLAWCETHSNWQNGGNWAGGLGIARSTWKGFGGQQFARTPDKATREEQIIVANRIAIYGWQTKSFLNQKDRESGKHFFRRPVGFNGWGALPCAGGRPPLVRHTPETVLAQSFKWNQKGRVVGDLQAILGVRQTFVYDSATYASHQRFIIKHDKPRGLAPLSPKVKRPTRVPKSKTKRCPQFEQMAFDAGFPKNQIQIVSYIMWKESRCLAGVTNSKDPNSGSRGLLQINGFWTKHLIKDGVISNEKQLFDPATNLRAGFYVWTHALMKARYNYGWSPWSVW
jgi:hypothetical protein